MMSLWFLVLINSIIGFLMGITPYISRTHIPFGVTLPITTETRPTIESAKRRYFKIQMGLSIVLSLFTSVSILLVSTLSDEIISYMTLFNILALIVCSFATHSFEHQKLKKYQAELGVLTDKKEKVVIDLKFRNQKLIVPTVYLVMLNIVFVVFTVWLTVSQYANIPDQMITNWDFNFNPTRVVDKSWSAALSIPALQLFLTVVLGIGNQAFLSAKQQLNSANPKASAERSKRFRKQSSIVNVVISILIQSLLTVLQMMIVLNVMSPQIVLGLSVMVMVAIFAIVIWYSLRYGQSGDRLRDQDVNEVDAQPLSISKEADAHWKLGIIYSNPNDPSIWVEKRMGVGLTMNFARWQSWLFLVSVIAIPLMIAYFMG